MASSSLKLNFEKFDGKGNFTLWQQRVKDLLVQQRIYKVLVKQRPDNISPEDWEELEEIAFSTIRMCLADQVLPEICTQTTAKGLWETLENTYMGKSMTNKLWLKKQLYSLRMLEGGESGEGGGGLTGSHGGEAGRRALLHRHWRTNSPEGRRSGGRWGEGLRKKKEGGWSG